MPRFHFNIHDGVNLPDPVGTELRGWKEARFEAVRLAGAILRDVANRLSLEEDWRMEVTDDSGLILFQIVFSVLPSASVLGQMRSSLPVVDSGQPS